MKFYDFAKLLNRIFDKTRSYMDAVNLVNVYNDMNSPVTEQPSGFYSLFYCHSRSNKKDINMAIKVRYDKNNEIDNVTFIVFKSCDFTEHLMGMIQCMIPFEESNFNTDIIITNVDTTELEKPDK